MGRRFTERNLKMIDEIKNYNNVNGFHLIVINDGQKNSRHETGDSGTGENFDKNIYIHKDWKNRTQDEPHGNINQGDLILFYFGSHARINEKHQKIIKYLCKVTSITQDKTEIKFDRIKELIGITYDELGKIKKTLVKKQIDCSFNKFPQQGINVTNLSKEEFEFILNADKYLHKNIWLCSLKSDESYAHFEDTVLKSQETSKIPIGVEAKSHSHLCIWGTKKTETYLKKWELMQNGDLILFCRGGGSKQPLTNYYSHAAVIEGKEENEELAQNIWGTTDDGTTWKLIFWMKPETLSEEYVVMSIFNPIFEYSIENGHEFPGPMQNSPIMKISLENVLGALISK
jgi:hypothetical protein